jgi:hypothetical protein
MHVLLNARAPPRVCRRTRREGTVEMIVCAWLRRVSVFRVLENMKSLFWFLLKLFSWGTNKRNEGRQGRVLGRKPNMKRGCGLWRGNRVVW